MRCLITGANGFLGRSLVTKLINSGHDVIAVGRNIGNHKNKAIKYIIYDLAQIKPLDSLDSVDIVIHLAYQFHREDQPICFDNSKRITANIAGIYALLDSLNGVKRLIQASTVFVYPWESNEKITEDLPPSPFTIYGWEKLIAEKLSEEYCDRHSIQLAILRFTQIYGPGDPHSQFITRILHDAMTGKDVCIFGQGEDARDILFIDDAVNAIDLCVESNSTGIYNISSGQLVDIKNCAQLCLELTGRDPSDLKYRPRTIESVRVAYSSEKAKMDFGFYPRTSLREGLLKSMMQTG